MIVPWHQGASRLSVYLPYLLTTGGLIGVRRYAYGRATPREESAIFLTPLYIEWALKRGDGDPDKAARLERILPILGNSLYVAPSVYALVLVSLGLSLNFMWAYAIASTAA